MCNKITVLAKNDRLRSVGACEHGTIHVKWDHLVIFMVPSELKRVAMVLQTTVVEREATPLHPGLYRQQSDYWLAEHTGYFQVWIGPYALELSPVDYSLFSSLISRAAARLPKSKKKPKHLLKIRVVEKFDHSEDALGMPKIDFSTN